MLNEKRMLDYFGIEAIATTIYIKRRTPTITVHGMIPKEKYTCKKNQIFLVLKVFGCIASSHS